MDQLRAYMEAAAAATDTTEDNAPAVPKAVMLKIEVHGIVFSGDGSDVPALPRCGGKTPSGQCNGAAPPMGTDKVMAVEGGGGCDLLKCAECEKLFKSARALYGHLRCHPEKGYRGASRPANAAAAAPAASKKAKKSPRKERRITDEEAALILMEMSCGQRQEPEVPEQPMLPDHVANAAAVAQPVVPDHVPVAVAVAGQHMWEAEKPAAQVESVMEVVMATTTEAGHALRAAHVAKVTTAPQSPVVMKKPAKPDQPVADGVVVVPLNEHGVAAAGAGKPPASSPGAHSSKKVSLCARKSKKRKLQDLEQAAPVTLSPGAADVKPPARRIPSPASDKRYTCPCGQAFPSHQALGGHVAGHKRDSIHHHRHAVVGEAASARLGEERPDNNPSSAPPAAQHRCPHPDCNMLFPSGQSLGGHMRKHRPPAQATAAAPSAPEPAQATAAASSAPEPAQTTVALSSAPQPAQDKEASSPPQPVPSGAGMPRDFDLNELPRDEGESKP